MTELDFVKITESVLRISMETKIHLINRKSILSSHSIGHFSKLLNANDFYTVHKSYVVNLSYIEKYLNEGSLIFVENHKVPVSRNRR